MFDFYDIGLHFKEPLLITGRLAGNGTSNLLAVANVADSQTTKTSVNRSGVGNHIVTFLDIPLGIPQSYAFWLSQPSGAAPKVVNVPPYVAGTTPYAFTCNVVYATNNAAVDVATTEELHFELWFRRSNV